jgi:hypothetical protein
MPWVFFDEGVNRRPSKCCAGEFDSTAWRGCIIYKAMTNSVFVGCFFGSQQNSKIKKCFSFSSGWGSPPQHYENPDQYKYDAE